MAIWAEKHAPYTRFLPRPARKESNVPKIKSTLEVIVLIYMLAFVCIIRSFAETYKQTAFICKETNSIKFIWLMLNLPKSCKLVHL